MEHEDLTKVIIDCAYRVYNAMKFGYLESVYEKCLMLELSKAGLSAESQKPIPVMYHGEPVGDFIADVVVEDTVIVELKSAREIAPIHEAQLVNYLTATGRPVGLLLNFGEDQVDVKRKVRTLKKR